MKIIDEVFGEDCLVKDVRTNYETTNTNKVLDGDILEFMNEYLRIKR